VTAGEIPQGFADRSLGAACGGPSPTGVELRFSRNLFLNRFKTSLPPPQPPAGDALNQAIRSHLAARSPATLGDEHRRSADDVPAMTVARRKDTVSLP